jgi:hypothetical protein
MFAHTNILPYPRARYSFHGNAFTISVGRRAGRGGSSIHRTMNRPESLLEREPVDYDEGISLLGWGTVVLRRRRLIVTLALLGGLAGLLSGLLSARVYKANVTFLPQGSAESLS